MFFKWLPWNFILSRLAKSYGFIDPAMVLARIRSFSRPSETQEPLELLREGVIFQARGLINTRVFQFNLDWVWPYWVEKQYNPNDSSFIPRAHSFSHINLTHRNWTAVGLPDLPLYPLVDPRGLITPHYDGWSLDFWIVTSDNHLLPSKLQLADQRQLMDPELTVVTEVNNGNLHLQTRVWLEISNNIPFLKIKCTGQAEEEGRLVLAFRPYNPEGVSFIEHIEYDRGQKVFFVNGRTPVFLEQAPEKIIFSNFERGDVYHQLNRKAGRQQLSCQVGLLTAAALFPLRPLERMSVDLTIPLNRELEKNFPKIKPASRDWRSVLSSAARMETPDARLNELYASAVQTLILLSAGDIIYPGPYNYRRFWFRDACLMINALLALGLKGRCRSLIDTFPERQKITGFFQSQDGEWDSNGQVLWIMDRYLRLTGERLPGSWIKAVTRGVQWLIRKRITDAPGSRHQGLLPAGFSAEHLGPNDFYYWDDFWGLAGLRSGARMLETAGLSTQYEQARRAADIFEDSIWRSLVLALRSKKDRAFPASPYRRMDAGAIGSLVADYPLQLLPPNNIGIMSTCEWLMKHCFHEGGFFQDMVHSGINCYLTLALAQTLLRAGDQRYLDLIRYVADLASPTGHWPEAVHPFTGGGCMGDGQHGWAAAEWVMIMRNLFIREEKEILVIGSGVFPEWLSEDGRLTFGPTSTPYGDLAVRLDKTKEGLFLTLNGEIRSNPRFIEARIPGTRPFRLMETGRAYKVETRPDNVLG